MPKHLRNVEATIGALVIGRFSAELLELDLSNTIGLKFFRLRIKFSPS